ncbi:MAG: hypothetical protein J5656_06755 [Clostridia bacterium]|nr:hypothetical protein [Clostridia bacterium]
MLDLSIDFDKDAGSKVLRIFRGELRILENLLDRRAEVGVFAESTRDDGKSNVDIAIAHEYGVPDNNIPQRSFLAQPLVDGTYESMLEKEHIKINSKTISKLASIFLKAVKEEFKTNGQGEWQPLSPRTKRKRNKNRSQLLRDTTQLYNAIEKREYNIKTDETYQIITDFYMF